MPRSSQPAHFEAESSEPCVVCAEPLFGAPRFCPFCGKARAVPELLTKSAGAQIEIAPALLAAMPVELEGPATGLVAVPVPTAEQWARPAAIPLSPPAPKSVAKSTSTTQPATARLEDPPISRSPAQKPWYKLKRNGLILSLVLLGLFVLALINHWSGGGEPQRVANVYDIGNHWKEIETPVSGDFALASDAALRIRSGEKTWFVRSNSHAKLDGLDVSQPLELRSVAGRARVQVLTP